MKQLRSARRRVRNTLRRATDQVKLSLQNERAD